MKKFLPFLLFVSFVLNVQAQSLSEPKRRHLKATFGAGFTGGFVELGKESYFSYNGYQSGAGQFQGGFVYYPNHTDLSSGVYLPTYSIGFRGLIYSRPKSKLFKKTMLETGISYSFCKMDFKNTSTINQFDQYVDVTNSAGTHTEEWLTDEIIYSHNFPRISFCILDTMAEYNSKRTYTKLGLAFWAQGFKTEVNDHLYIPGSSLGFPYSYDMDNDSRIGFDIILGFCKFGKVFSWDFEIAASGPEPVYSTVSLTLGFLISHKD